MSLESHQAPGLEFGWCRIQHTFFFLTRMPTLCAPPYNIVFASTSWARTLNALRVSPRSLCLLRSRPRCASSKKKQACSNPVQSQRASHDRLADVWIHGRVMIPGTWDFSVTSCHSELCRTRRCQTNFPRHGQPKPSERLPLHPGGC